MKLPKREFLMISGGIFFGAFMINQQIQNYIERMPGFSTTVTKVMEVCNRPATSSHDLNRVISLDPVLTGKVLKLINSAFYSLGREVTSLTHAIILLGINTIKNLALSNAVLEGIGGRKDAFRCLSMDDFWVHSLGVGVISRSFARLTGIPVTDQEEYFVAGLLHDLGKIPLNHCCPEAYKRSMEAVNLEHKTLYEAEKTYLGLDHCRVGGLIAEKWRLHRDLSDVFYFHHDQSEEREKCRFVVIVSLANCYANYWEIGSAGDTVTNHSLIDRLQKRLNIDAAQITAMHDRVLEDIDNARIFLKVATEG